MYYKLITGDDYDILQIGGSSMADDAVTSIPTLSKETHAVVVNDLPASSGSILKATTTNKLGTYLTSLELNYTQLVTYFENAFYDCSALTNVEFKGSLNNLADANYMFYNCGFESIELPDLPSLNYAEYMFANCKNLSTITHGVMGNGNYYYDGRSYYSSYEHMFDGCSLLTAFNFKDVYVRDCSYMFNKCQLLVNVSNLSSHLVTNINYMFYGCTLLSIKECYFPNITKSQYTFYNCTSLTSLKGSYIGNSCGYEFYGCSSLTTLTTAGLSSYTRNTSMFSGCLKLVGGNGTKYDANNCGSDQAIIDDGSNGGYLTYTTGKDIYTITYDVTPTFIASASSSYNSILLATVKNCEKRVADGSTLNLESIGTYANITNWLIKDSNNNYNLKEGTKVSIPVTDNLTIYPISNLGGSTSSDILIKVIANPQ